MAPKSDRDQYKVKLRGPGHWFKRSVSQDVANRIINLVMTGVATSASPSGPPGDEFRENMTSKGSEPGNASQFMAQKRPANNSERVACLAYYLSHYQRQAQLKTIDIIELNTAAAGAPFDNPSGAVANATALYGYLSGIGGGKKQLTTLGEEVVKALPDREKVAAAIAKHRAARRKKR